jgi:hypothetical protein
MNTINTSNTQTPDQDCLTPSDSYAYETNQTQTQSQTQTQIKTQTQTHTLLNKRYEELRTQILELRPPESLGVHSPLSPSPSPSPSSATQWWDQWERKSGQIGEEYNIITQQGMASWLEVWLELKPIIRAGACDGDGDNDRNIDTHTDTHTDMAGDVNVNIGTGSIENENLYKIRNSGMILDFPGALVGVLSDMVLNAVNVAHLNNKYKYNHNT